MDVLELKSNIKNSKQLTDNDIKRLNKMLKDQKFVIFKETIVYILSKNIKLEQEILD